MEKGEHKSRGNPFRVPDDYFRSLAERTLGTIRVMEEGDAKGVPAGEAAGSMAPAGEADRSMAPAGETAVHTGRSDKVPAGDSDKSSRHSISLKPFLAFAALLAGFAILGTIIVRLVVGVPGETEYEYGVSHYADLMAEEIDISMIEYELSLYQPEGNTFGIDDEEISTDVIIDYLVNEEIDLNDIYELI